MPEVVKILNNLTEQFLNVHTTKEDLFWETKMGLGADANESQLKLSKAEIGVQQFLHNAQTLGDLTKLEDSALAGEQKKILNGWIRMFQANAIEDPKAQALSEEIVRLEGELQSARGAMKLGYMDPKTGEFIPASSNVLSNIVLMNTDEAMRKAAFAGRRSIEPFAIENGFLEIVKKRNELGRMLGYEDYYDMKVQRTEGFSKQELFKLLDDLEVRTRDVARSSVKAFASEHGNAAIEPWNFSHYRMGSVAEERDPYFPFEHSLECWVKSYAALGIKYRGAKLTLDLIDRKGKYENGFMHGPVPGFFNNGKWNAARINFTANAMPDRVGSGPQAVRTLFHEGGHAAHFSNVLQPAPCFAQEFAPTSVAYAETQSMFLDSIISDADWETRYLRSRTGEPMPWNLTEKVIRLSQPFVAIGIRSMLTVCYVEKALYEMSDTEMTGENVLNMIRETEQRLEFLSGSPRPVLSVPHLLSGESSAYYHGYVLAEMAVHQTREYFEEKYGHILDNPHVGPELAAGYWASGNSEQFFDLVERLTGKPFSADAIVRTSNRTADQAVEMAKKQVAHLPTIPEYGGPFDLDAEISVIHGHEVITKFGNGEFERADSEFKNWVKAHYPRSNGQH
jgi:Zn-dependent oligopeptidase